MLSSNLRKYRKEKGLTQEQLATKINVVRQTVSKWESGLSAPDAETLIKISDVLETPVQVLIGESIDTSDSQNDVEVIAEKLTEINEQLAKSSDKRRKVIRTVSYISLALVLLALIWSVVSALHLYSLVMANDPSTHAIGGANEPTGIFVTSQVSPVTIIVMIIVLVGSIIGLSISRKN